METGRCIDQFGAQGNSHGNFNRPMKLDVCATNRCLYVCDLNNYRIQVFHLCTSKFFCSIAKLFKPQDVHAYKDKIYVLDKSDPCMHIFGVDNILLSAIISHGDSSGFKLQVSWFFCVDPSQNILIPYYITDEVKVFDSNCCLF